VCFLFVKIFCCYVYFVSKETRKHAVLRACEYCFGGQLNYPTVPLITDNTMTKSGSLRNSMQKCGKILRGRKDTLTLTVSTLRGRSPPSPHRSDASATDQHVIHWQRDRRDAPRHARSAVHKGGRSVTWQPTNVRGDVNDAKSSRAMRAQSQTFVSDQKYGQRPN